METRNHNSDKPRTPESESKTINNKNKKPALAGRFVNIEQRTKEIPEEYPIDEQLVLENASLNRYDIDDRIAKRIEFEKNLKTELAKIEVDIIRINNRLIGNNTTVQERSDMLLRLDDLTDKKDLLQQLFRDSQKELQHLRDYQRTTKNLNIKTEQK